MDKRMDISTLENWLWDAACYIRGPIDAPKFKEYILPLLFYKRLCDVYEDEIKKLSKEFENEQFAKNTLKELFKTLLHKLMSGEKRLKEVEI